MKGVSDAAKKLLDAKKGEVAGVEAKVAEKKKAFAASEAKVEAAEASKDKRAIKAALKESDKLEDEVAALEGQQVPALRDPAPGGAAGGVRERERARAER